MNQVVVHTSTYSSDEFGVCSALYELGGMVVMHDASGCNSTYTTHDEPRWYDMDSMIYISAISEMEAIMGDDSKLIRDIVETASRLKPKFIAIVGAPIPYMTGTDYDAISRVITEETGIPCFGFPTNGMQYYTQGISMALEKIVEHFCVEGGDESAGDGDKDEETENREKEYGKKESELEFIESESGGSGYKVNILGATPLDFSINSTLDSIKDWLRENDMEPGVCLAMGCTLEDIKTMGRADVNIVISYGGLAAARVLKERFGTPYVVGVPYGEAFSKKLAEDIKKAAKAGESMVAYDILGDASENENVSAGQTDELTAAESVNDLPEAKITDELSEVETTAEFPVDELTDQLSEPEYKDELSGYELTEELPEGDPGDKLPEAKTADRLPVTKGASNAENRKVLIIGESVLSASLAAAIKMKAGISTTVTALCPVDTDDELVTADMIIGENIGINDISIDEVEIEKLIEKSDVIIADPLYRTLCRGAGESQKFIDNPHTAFSGRMYEKQMPDLIGRDLMR